MLFPRYSEILVLNRSYSKWPITPSLFYRILFLIKNNLKTMCCFWHIWLLIGLGSCWCSRWEMFSTFFTNRQIFWWFQSDDWQVELLSAKANPFFCQTVELVSSTHGADTVYLDRVNWVLSLIEGVTETHGIGSWSYPFVRLSP